MLGNLGKEAAQGGKMAPAQGGDGIVVGVLIVQRHSGSYSAEPTLPQVVLLLLPVLRRWNRGVALTHKRSTLSDWFCSLAGSRKALLGVVPSRPCKLYRRSGMVRRQLF